jgi:hypothetical protein
VPRFHLDAVPFYTRLCFFQITSFLISMLHSAESNEIRITLECGRDLTSTCQSKHFG